MVRFVRCFPHAMGSPRAEEVGEVMWPSPPHFFTSLTFCFGDLSPLSAFYSDYIRTHSHSHTVEGLV